MKAQTRTYHPGHPGTWPGGEPQQVRDAYDAQRPKPSAEPKPPVRVPARPGGAR